MTLRRWVGFSIGAVLFLMAFALCLRVLPARPVMTVAPPEGNVFATFSADGRFLVTQPHVRNRADWPLRFWRIPDGRQALILEQGETPDLPTSYRVICLPDGKLLLDRRFAKKGKNWSYSLRLVEIATGQDVLRVESEDEGCFSDDGRKLATRTSNYTAIWDIPNRSRDVKFMSGTPIAFSPDSRTLLCREDGTGGPGAEAFSLLDVATGNELQRITVPGLSQGNVQFSADGRTLVFNKYADGYPLFSPEGRSLTLSRVDPARGGKNSHSGFLKIWNVGINRGKLAWPAVDECRLALGDTILAGVEQHSGQTVVRFWDMANGQELDSLNLKARQNDYLSCFLSAPADGRYIAVTTVSQSRPRTLPTRMPRWKWLSKLWERSDIVSDITLLDVASNQSIATIDGLPYVVDESRFSPDGSLLLVVGRIGLITVWQVPPSKPLWPAAGLAVLFVGMIWSGRTGYRWLKKKRNGVSGDTGDPIVHKIPDAPIAKSYLALAATVMSELKTTEKPPELPSL
jgi:WD40 repeat protein